MPLTNDMPDINRILHLINKPVELERFNHCSNKLEASVYDEGERFYCHKCHAHGNAVDLMNSLGYKMADTEAFLRDNFPGFVMKDARFDVDPSKKMLTPLVELAHKFLLSEHPKVIALRAWMLAKWGITLDDIKTHTLGFFVEPLLHHLPLETQQVLLLQELVLGSKVRIDKHLIYPQFKNGYVSYIQSRSTDPNCEKGRRHLKWKMFNRMAYGYERATSIAKSKGPKKPLIVVEGISDYIAMDKLGYPCVATLSAGVNDPRVIAQIAKLHEKCSGTIIEYDLDGSSTGVTRAESLALKFCASGVDAIPTITSPDHFTQALPEPLASVEKLDVAEVVSALGVERAKELYHEKYCNLMNVHPETSDRTGNPDTYLHRLIRKVSSPEDINTVYTLLALQPSVLQPTYFAGISEVLKHKEPEIRKNIKRCTPTKAADLLDVEDDEVPYYHRPAQDYTWDETQQVMYATKCGFTRHKNLVDPDTNEYQRIDLLNVITTKTSASDTDRKAETFLTRQFTRSECVAQGSKYPLADVNKDKAKYFWESSVLKPSVDVCSLKEVMSDFEAAQKAVHAPGLYQQVYQHFADRVCFSKEVFIHLCTTYAMLTYVYKVFPAIPYLHIRGAKNSGKTQILKAFQDLSFNPIVVTGSPTVATIFRNIEQFCPTYIMDEQEFRTSVKGQVSDSSQEIHGIINSGYQAGASVERVINRRDIETGLEYRDIERFDTYCPKIFSGINSFYETLESRCILIATKTASLEEAARLKKESHFHNDVVTRGLQNKLMVWSLGAGLDLSEWYVRVLKDPDFQVLTGNRDAQLFAPIIALIKHLGDPMNCLSLMEEHMRTRQVEQSLNVTGSLTYHVLRDIRMYVEEVAERPTHHYKAGIVYITEKTTAILTAALRAFYRGKLADYSLMHATDDGKISELLCMRILNKAGIIHRTTVSSREKVALYEPYYTPVTTKGKSYYDVTVLNIEAIQNTIDTIERGLIPVEDEQETTP